MNCRYMKKKLSLIILVAAASVLFSCSAMANVPVAGVTLDAECNIVLGDNKDTEQLTALILPVDAANKNVTWSSDNEAVATVDASGLVTGKAPGYAAITVKTEDGCHTAVCSVIVSDIHPVP